MSQTQSTKGGMRVKMKFQSLSTSMVIFRMNWSFRDQIEILKAGAEVGA